MNMTREELITQIDNARVKGYAIPTNVFGRKVFVKTTKHGLVAQIRNEFKEDQKVALQLSIDKEHDVAIIESTRGNQSPGEIELMLQEGAERPPAPRSGRRGRPKGSKNRPKEAVEAKSNENEEKRENTE